MNLFGSISFESCGAYDDSMIEINSECNVMQEMPIDSDTLIEVLARLPAKSLLKFKCVSKHWFSLITHPYFMNLCRSRSSARTIVLITLSPEYTIYRILNPSPSHRFLMIDGRKQEFNSWAQFYEPFLADPTYKVTNTANGFICFYHVHCDNEGWIPIYNLTTREELPLSRVTNVRLRKKKFYLGFDPTNEQYKVLDVFSIDESKVHCQVLTVSNEGNTWRPVETSNIEDASNFLSVDHGFCRDRSLYWNLYFCFDNFDHGIVEFNAGHEMFEFIRYPPEISLSEGYFSVCQIRGHVSLVALPLRPQSSNLDITLLELIDRKSKDRPLWTKEVINCPSFSSKWEKVTCNDFRLISLVHSSERSDIVTIDCYDLTTGRHMIINLENDPRLIGDAIPPLIMVENITLQGDVGKDAW